MINPVSEPAGRGLLLRWLGWLVVAQTLVLSLIALRYLDVADLANGFGARLFGISMFPAHFLSLALLSMLPLMLLAVIWPLRHLIGPLAWLFHTLVAILLLVDTVVFQQYRFHLNGALVTLFFSGASDETFEFSLAMKLQLAAVVLAIALLQWGIARGLWRFVSRARHRRAGYGVAAAAVALLLGNHGFHAWADANGDAQITSQARMLLGYSPLTAKGFLEEQGYDVAEQSWGSATSIDGPLAYPREPLVTEMPESPKNIVMLVVDSWRYDSLNAEVMPETTAFARSNTRFSNYYSAGNATRMGMFTLFYGIPGTYWHSALQTNTRPVLVNRLLALDYDFGIYRSALLSSPEFHRTLFSGMDYLRMASDGHDSPARDIDATEDFIDFLERRQTQGQSQAQTDPERSGPFFGMLFLDAPHAYDLPEDHPRPFQPSWDAVNYLALDEDTDPTGLHNLYRNSLYFIDGLIGRTLDALEAQGLMDDTIVIVTGDHGQEFNDLGLNYWGHNGNFSRFQTQTPMIVHWPGRSRSGATLDHLATSLDVAPTLLEDALGVSNAFAATSTGHDLFEPTDRLPVIMAKYSSHAAMTEDGFVIFHPLGPVEAVDRDYRPVDASPPPGVIRATLEKQTLFRASND